MNRQDRLLTEAARLMVKLNDLEQERDRLREALLEVVAVYTEWQDGSEYTERDFGETIVEARKLLQALAGGEGE